MVPSWAAEDEAVVVIYSGRRGATTRVPVVYCHKRKRVRMVEGTIIYRPISLLFIIRDKHDMALPDRLGSWLLV
jgi:hypothetical protein